MFHINIKTSFSTNCKFANVVESDMMFESYEDCEEHLKQVLTEIGSNISESDSGQSCSGVGSGSSSGDSNNEELLRQVMQLHDVSITMVHNQQILLKEVSLLKTRQDEVITLLRNLNLTPDVNFQPSNEYKLPIQNLEELKCINDILSSTDEKRKLIKYLLPIGGKSAQDCTYRIMDKLFASTLSTQMNWVGKNEKKYGIINSPNIVTSIVHSVTVSMKCPNKDVEEYIKSFLRSATDRYGFRKKATGSKGNKSVLTYDEEILEGIVDFQEDQE
ncbi:hypothetical protein FQR65_LT09621 [Abscondita terminalis]|nr:hypothetical protein FQR65_LT09621 [Abscondita terminalis]